MKLLLQMGITITITISLMALFFLPKKRVKLIRVPKIQRFIEQQNQLSKWLKRSRLSVEVFVTIHLIALCAVLVIAIQNIFGYSNASVYTPLWGLALLYSLCRIRNVEFRRKVAKDVEEALRLSFLFERSGTDNKKINNNLAQEIKGPLQTNLIEIASGNSLNVDLELAYQKMKKEYKDIRAVVNFCNINIHKIKTGKTGSLYKQQLDQIKSLKLERFKMKRMANRVKLCLIAVLLVGSLLSITVYPMLLETYKLFIGSMSN